MAIGISFDANSFKEFNKQLEKFNDLSTKVDNNLKKIGSSVETMLNGFNATNATKIEAMAGAVQAFSDVFKNFDAKKIKEFNSVFRSVMHSFSALSKLGFFTSFNSNMTNFQNFIKFFNDLMTELGKLKSFDISNLQKFSSSIVSTVNTFQKLGTLKLDTSNIAYNLNNLQMIIKEFSGTNLGFFGNLANRFKNFFGKGTTSFVDQINSLGSANIEGFRKFALGMSGVITSFASMGSIKIDADGLKKMLEFVQTFIKTFTGATGFLGGIRNTIKTMFGRDGGFINQIATVKIDNLSKFSGFAGAIKNITDAMQVISKININPATIQNFAKTISELFKALNTQLGGGNIFQRMIGGFKNMFGLFGQAPYDRIIRLADALDKLTRSAKAMGDIQKAMELNGVIETSTTAGENAGKGFITGFKRILQIASPSRVMQQLGAMAALGFTIGFKPVTGVFKAIQGAMSSLFSKVKSVASSIGGFFKNLVPANPFKRLENDATQSAGIISRAFSGIKNMIMIDISGALSSISSQAYETFVGAAISFESGFAGVLKAMDFSDLPIQEQAGAIEELDQSMRDLATNSTSVLSGLDNASDQILTIAENAGSLGIARENLQAFTETVGAMAIATNLNADAASTFFGTFGAITQSTEYEKIGSTMVELGNRFSATESQIADFALRLAGAGNSAGLTEDQILGVSAAMASVGLNAEAGGSAMTEIFNTFTEAAYSGGDALDGFTEVMGISAKEFSELWKNEPTKALENFISKFDELDAGTQISVLDGMGLDGIRTADTIRRLAGAEGVLSDALNIANDGWTENAALMEEARKRNETTEASLNRMHNNFFNLQVIIGRFFMPIFKVVIDAITNGVGNLTNFLENSTESIVAFFQGIYTFFEPIITALQQLFEAYMNFVQAGVVVGERFAQSISTNFAVPLSQFKVFVDEIGLGIGTITDFLNKASSIGQSMPGMFGTPFGGLEDTSGRIGKEEHINELYNERMEIIEKMSLLQEEGGEAYNDYIVEAGDTLSEIAANAGISLDDLLEANNLNLSDAKNLQIGKGLKIPVKFSPEDTAAELSKLQTELDELDKKAGGSAGGVSTNYTSMMESIELVKGSVHSLAWEELPQLKTGFSELATGDYTSGFTTISDAISSVIQKLKDLGIALGEALFFKDTSSESVMATATTGIFSDSGAEQLAKTPTAIGNLVEGVQAMFTSAFTDIDLNPQAQLLLNALGLAVSFIFGAPGALAFGLAKLVSKAIADDFLGLGTLLKESGLYESIETAFAGVREFMASIFGDQRSQAAASMLSQDVVIGGEMGWVDQTTVPEAPKLGLDKIFADIEKIANNPVVKVFTDMLSSLGASITAFIDAFADIDVTNVVTVVGQIIEWIGLLGGSAVVAGTYLINTIVIPALTNFADQISIFLNSLSEEDVNGFAIAFTAFLGLINAPAIIAFIAAISGPIALLSGLANSIGTFAAAFGDLFGAVDKARTGDVEGTLEGLQSFVSGIWNAFKDFTVGAVQPFIDIINKLLELAGADFKLISVEQAFADLETYIKGLGITIILFFEDIANRVELWMTDLKLKAIDVQISVNEGLGPLKDQGLIDSLKAQREELSGMYEDQKLTWDFQSSFTSGNLDLSKVLTVETFDGETIQKSLTDLINDPTFMSSISGSTRNLLQNAADKALSDPAATSQSKLDAYQVYKALGLPTPAIDMSEIEVTNTKDAYNLAFAGEFGFKVDDATLTQLKADYQNLLTTVATSGDLLNAGNMREFYENMGVDVSAMMTSGIETGLANNDLSTVFKNFALDFDFENGGDVQTQFNEALARLADSIGMDNALKVASMVEIPLENLTLDATGAAVDLKVNQEGITAAGQDLKTEEQLTNVFNIGKDLIQGIVDGVTDPETDLSTALTNIFDTANQAFKDAAGIESPSTVFIEHGANVMEGLGQGITENIGFVGEAFGPVMSVLNSFGQQTAAIFQTYNSSLALAGTTTLLVALQITGGFTTMILQSMFLGIALDGLLFKITAVLGGLANLAVGAQVALNAGAGTSIPVAGTPITPAGGMPVEGGLAVGGNVQAGKIYEVLENNLPFELFETGGRQYFLSNQNGEMHSPKTATNLLNPNYGMTSNTNNVSNNSNDTIVINANIPPTADTQEVVKRLEKSIRDSKRKDRNIGKTLRRNGVST